MAVIPTTSKCPQCGELLKWEGSRGFFDSKGHEYASIPQAAPVVSEEPVSPEAPVPSLTPPIPVRTVPAAPQKAQDQPKPPDPPKPPSIPVRTILEAPKANGSTGVVFAPNGDALVTIRVEQHHWSGLEAACRAGSWGEALQYFESRIRQAFSDRWFW